MTDKLILTKKKPINYAYNRILLIDLEVSGNLGYFYDRKWEAKIFKVKEYQRIISISYKWFGKDKVYTYCLADFPTWKKDRMDDTELVLKLWEAMNQADIIVAHNLKKFDLKKANTRFLIDGLEPPQPAKYVDTLLIAKNKFGFIGNSLGDLGEQLGIGSKEKTGHSDLWEDCIINDKHSAWVAMKRYNAQDVLLLERLLKKFWAWFDIPRVSFDSLRCKGCGGTNFVRSGKTYRATGYRFRLRCVDCGNRNNYSAYYKKDE